MSAAVSALLYRVHKLSVTVSAMTTRTRCTVVIVGVAGIVATDFAFGYNRWKAGNQLMRSRTLTKQRALFRESAKPLALKQSVTKALTFESPTFLRTELSFHDWLFQYFYQTRLNLYANAMVRYVDTYFIHYSKRRSPDLQIVGKVLTEMASFHAMIDPPNLQRHRYVLNRLGINTSNGDNLLFFSDVNVFIPFQNSMQRIEFIEICCEIDTQNQQCTALFWRLQTEKFGYLEMGDARMNIEQFMAIVVLWSTLKLHAICHAYGEQIIRKKPSKTADEEMRRICSDFKATQVSMVALNHVVRYTVPQISEHIDAEMLQKIIDLNSMNAVWKHNVILMKKELLSQMRVTRFLLLARQKLLRLFTVNKLHSYLNFEAAFVALCVHGVDHWAGHIVQNVTAKLSLHSGLRDLLAFTTVYGAQNAPIVRESRLKYVAKSKMLKSFADYLEFVDPELANAVDLIQSS